MILQDNIILPATIIIALIICIAFVVYTASWLNFFSREIKYIKTEIGRTSGSEKKYWLSRKRRLYLSIIPFIKY